MFNMLVVPGLAVPTGSNVYTFFTHNLINLQQVLRNFYQLNSADFFIILILQQTMFGFFGSINYLNILTGFGFSPSAFLLYKRQPLRDQMFLKYEAITFDFGYINALNLTILGIVYIYS